MLTVRPQSRYSLEPRTSATAEDEILRFAAATVAVEALTDHEARNLGTYGMGRMMREIEYDVQTRRLAAYNS